MKPLLLSLILLPLVGCAHLENKQVHHKTTIFGFQATTPELGYGALTLQFGLIRDDYFSNPTSTNRLYYAPWHSNVDAHLNAIRQSAVENYGTGIDTNQP